MRNKLFTSLVLATIWFIFSGFLNFSENSLTDKDKNSIKRIGLFIELNNHVTYINHSMTNSYSKKFPSYFLNINQTVQEKLKDLLVNNNLEVVIIPSSFESIMMNIRTEKAKQMVETLLTRYKLDAIMILNQDDYLTDGLADLPDGFYLKNIFGSSRFLAYSLINIIAKKEDQLQTISVAGVSMNYKFETLVWDTDKRELITNKMESYKEETITSFILKIKEKMQEINLLIQK